MRKIFPCIIILLIMTGCAQQSVTPATVNPSPNATSSLDNTVQTTKIMVTALAPTEFSAQIAYAPEGKFLSEWPTDGAEISINGGYFDADFTPSGFLMINKKRIGSRLFDQDKSGLIVINNGAVSIRDLATAPLKPHEQFEYALQSYPFLIKDGQSALTTDSQKRARRTALGIDVAGTVYIFTATAATPTLYEFMQEIQKLQLSLVSVLNLDGGPSTGIIMSGEENDLVVDSYTKISSILQFRKK